MATQQDIDSIRELSEQFLAEVKRRVGKDPELLKYVIQAPEIYMTAVTENGLALQYVEKQTPEICDAAIRQNKGARAFVNKEIIYDDSYIIIRAIEEPEFLCFMRQTPEIVKAVVEERPSALKYVKEQTPELCLSAVKQDGDTLRYVKEQTPEICMAAVKQNGLALRYVKERTPEICLAAVKRNGNALISVRNQTPELCMIAVQRNGSALEWVKEQTPEICLAAVQQDYYALKFVKEQTPEICVAAVRKAIELHDETRAMCYVKPEFRDQVKAALHPSLIDRVKGVFKKENKPKHSGPRM